MRVRLASVALTLTLALAALPAAGFSLVSLGSGDIDGGYFAAARAICTVVSRANRDELRCSPEATPGSVYNLSALRNGQLDFAIAQSDLQKSALDGTNVFANQGPMTGLRSVMALYPESVTVLARRDAGIARFGDLVGKRLDIGPPSSGRRATIARILTSFNLGSDRFAALEELPTGSAIAELCAGRIDATVLIVGHPNAGIARALAECDAVLVPVEGPRVDQLLTDNPDYDRTSIPAGSYPGVAAGIPTFAVTATLVTTEDADAAIVEAIVRDTLANLTLLGLRSPILAGLDPEAMRRQGLTAPLHPGAEAAFAAFLPGQ